MAKKKASTRVVSAPEAGNPPSYLPPDAALWWPSLVEELHSRGTLLRVSVHRLAIYCQLFAQYHRMTEWVNAHGQTAPTHYQSGEVKEIKIAPEAKRQTELVEALRKFDKEFGFLQEIQSENPLEELRQSLLSRLDESSASHN